MMSSWFSPEISAVVGSTRFPTDVEDYSVIKWLEIIEDGLDRGEVDPQALHVCRFCLFPARGFVDRDGDGTFYVCSECCGDDLVPFPDRSYDGTILDYVQNAKPVTLDEYKTAYRTTYGED